MHIQKSTENGIYNANLIGKFIYEDKNSFQSILEMTSNNEINEIVLNFEKLEYVDSYAVGMILLLRDSVESNKKLTIINANNARVKKILELSGIYNA